MGSRENVSFERDAFIYYMQSSICTKQCFLPYLGHTLTHTVSCHKPCSSAYPQRAHGPNQWQPGAFQNKSRHYWQTSTIRATITLADFHNKSHHYPGTLPTAHRGRCRHYDGRGNERRRKNQRGMRGARSRTNERVELEERGGDMNDEGERLKMKQ